jgi:hypothetical protein
MMNRAWRLVGCMIGGFPGMGAVAAIFSQTLWPASSHFQSGNLMGL